MSFCPGWVLRNLAKVVKPEVHIRRDTGILSSSLTTSDLSHLSLIPGEVGERKVGVR